MKYKLQQRELADYSLTITLGLTFGFAFGNILGNPGFGLAMGLAIANVVAALGDKRQQRDGANTALGISLAGVLIVLAIRIWS